MKYTPHDYQKYCIEYIREHPVSALFLDMGLGKTIITLTALNALMFDELKAPGKMMRPLQRKRRYQLMKLGFPVLCIDRLYQIKPCIDAILAWTPGEPFPEGIGAKIPDLEPTTLPSEIDDFGETLEPIDPDDLAGFYELEEDDTG